MTPRLTRRQADVVLALLGGLSNKQIAERLHIKPATVESHMYEIGDALGVRTARGIMAEFVSGEYALRKLKRLIK